MDGENFGAHARSRSVRISGSLPPRKKPTPPWPDGRRELAGEERREEAGKRQGTGQMAAQPGVLLGCALRGPRGGTAGAELSALAAISLD
jgi:hypothetical protein